MRLDWHEIRQPTADDFYEVLWEAPVEGGYTARVQRVLRQHHPFYHHGEIRVEMIDPRGSAHGNPTINPFHSETAAKAAAESYLDRRYPSGQLRPRSRPAAHREPQRFPITGAYANDCPFCETHNALLETGRDPEQPSHWLFQCRDCGRWFRQIGVPATEWEFIDEPRRSGGGGYARVRHSGRLRRFPTRKPISDPTYSREWSGVTGAPRARGLTCATCGRGVHREGDSYYCPWCDDYVRTVSR